MSAFDRIAIIGAGAFGTAMALVAAGAGRTVSLIARDENAAGRIAASRRSPHLPDAVLPPEIEVGCGPAALADVDLVLLAVPAQSLRSASNEFGAALAEGVPIVACAKGIEQATGRFMTEVLAETLPMNPPAILSGPSFAADIAAGLPTAVTLAADPGLAPELAAALAAPGFRPYHTDDIRGVEIGGAAKNVLAIAAGIVAGRGLGASAAAALTTRGFAELMRFGRAFGARPETLTGLSGLGDLILTCSGPKSRNFAYGMAIGSGAAREAPSDGGHLAEGAFTAGILARLAAERGLEMPVASAVAAIIEGRIGVDEAVDGLVSRPLRAES